MFSYKKDILSSMGGVERSRRETENSRDRSNKICP